MKDLENELRSALKRREPPANLLDSVLARIARGPAPRIGWRKALAAIWSAPRLRWVAAGALACLLIGAGVVHLHRAEQERAQGEAARAQLMQALRIASSKLNGTWRKVQGPEQHIPPS
ncbi:MAG: anti-sigma factor [Acidobacteriia bacterium]|nr:anti-sigma factor [Terriglobia bacterium]